MAYYLELQRQPEDDLQYVWVSMDAFTNRADKLGIPNLASGVVYQQFVSNLHVVCNVDGVVTGDISSGNIEFWPYNYTSGNKLGLPGANSSKYDFDDTCSFSANYSCMQVHNYNARQTLFAINHWSSGDVIDIGIGNRPTDHPDWTFSGNGGDFTVKTLYVLVRRDASDTTPPVPLSAQADFSRRLVTVSFSELLAPSSADPRLFTLDHGVAIFDATLEADFRTIRLLTSQQPADVALTLTITGVRDASPNANAVAPGTALPVAAPALPPEIITNIGTNAGDFASGYECVYTLDIPVIGNFNAAADPYRVNRARTAPVIDTFDRIAYYLELAKKDGTVQYLWASMDAFTTDRTKIAVPTLASGAIFQQPVSNLDVKSNVDGIVNGSGMAGGNLEFWPHNYSATNAAAVPGASDTTYDFGDRRDPGGHGSMQLHNSAAAQTLFAMNNWGVDGNTLALGIGNRPTSHPDWTFASNAGSDYTRRTMHVLVRPTAAPPLPQPVAENVPDAQGYRHVYTFDLPVCGSFFTSASTYTVFADTNNLPPYSRVAYYLELQAGTAPTQWIWTAMDAFTDDPSKIGLPGTNCFFQTRVTRLDVRSNVGGIVTGTDIDTGNIEFWPSNYGKGNSIGIPSASNSTYDFGDGSANGSQNGHGSMQVHNHGAGAAQTLFALSNFNNNNLLSIGIGNRPTGDPDWTFAYNAESYNHRRLYVFVLCAGSTADLTRPTLLNATASLTLDQIALGFNEPLADSSATPTFFTVSPDVTVLDAWLSPNKRDVILRTSPLTAGQLYSVSVTGVRDRSFNANPVAPGTALSFRAPVPYPIGPLADIPEYGDYELVSYLPVSNTVSYVNGANYLVDESRFQQIQPFDRVAYCMNLVDTNGVHKWVWVSMDAYTNDLSMIGVPTADRGARLQQYVSNLTVYASANVADISVSTGTGILAGNIEFWPNNYGAGNALNIPGASGSRYDWGDTIDAITTVGHGSMQVHNFAQGQTIFSMVSFGSNNRTPGLGIGNKPNASNDPDWTFTYNAREFTTKDIYILARRGVPATPTGTRPGIWNQPRSLKIRIGEDALFSVFSPNATGFQWRHNGTAIPGATASWLLLNDVKKATAGSYDVVVYGTGSQAILSQSATLTVIHGGTVMWLK
ncbi:MAG: Ig-like domain-containing protein [Kiritimatiellae bacterium]|nr:Ig-like domain-containing protein [Kiritimatiellia bacterium]